MGQNELGDLLGEINIGHAIGMELEDRDLVFINRPCYHRFRAYVNISREDHGVRVVAPGEGSGEG